MKVIYGGTRGRVFSPSGLETVLVLLVVVVELVVAVLLRRSGGSEARRTISNNVSFK